MMEVRFLLLGLTGNSDHLDLRIPRETFTPLSIKCNEANERFFERLCKAVARESCRLVPKVNRKKLKAEDFELVKDSKVGRNVCTKIYTKKPGKVKCRVSLKSPKDTIPIDELVNENFEGSCILRLYHDYLGSTKSVMLSVEETLVKKMDIMDSYFDDLSDESDSEDDE